MAVETNSCRFRAADFCIDELCVDIGVLGWDVGVGDGDEFVVLKMYFESLYLNGRGVWRGSRWFEGEILVKVCD